MTNVAEVLVQNQQRIRDAFWQKAHDAGTHYASIPLERLREGFYGTADAMIKAVVEQCPQILYDRWLQIAAVRADQGVVEAELQAVEGFLRSVTLAAIADEYAADCCGHLAALQTVEHTLHESRAGIASGFDEYGQTLLSRIETQRDELESVMVELSAPIVSVYKDILVMPLVGSIDSRRATVILETMLENIARTQANVVILDITGVPIVDTQVANYIIQTTRAARLLGAEVLLVGISPTIAQTIVQLGVDLSGITTRADLADGLAYALSLLGLSVQPLPGQS
ncbi:MAG: STAS domain-containing protein [Herpetosiphon sp.]